MALFRMEDKNIFYQIIGEGQPLLLLNGIMMSTLSWQPFYDTLSDNYKLILVDFLDQGQSSKMNENFKLDTQVEVINSLLEYLNEDNVNILGISYGGEIAIKFALKYQEKVNKLLLFNTTSFTNPWLHTIGRSWIDTARTYDPDAFYKVAIPIIYSPDFYSENIEWMRDRELLLRNVFNKEFLDAMIRLIESAEGYDVRDELYKIKVPTLVVAASNDYLTPPQEQEFIHKNIKQSEFLIIPNCGHASMYEKPNLFSSIVKGFISTKDKIEIIK